MPQATAATRLYIREDVDGAEWQEIDSADGLAQLAWGFPEHRRTRPEADGDSVTTLLTWVGGGCTFMVDDTLATREHFWLRPGYMLEVRIDAVGSAAGSERLEFSGFANSGWTVGPQGRTMQVAIQKSGSLTEATIA